MLQISISASVIETQKLILMKKKHVEYALELFFPLGEGIMTGRQSVK